VEEGALNRSVSVLRKALGETPSGQKYIETVPKRGYRFVAPVVACPSDSSKSIVEPHNRSVADIEVTHRDALPLPSASAPSAGRGAISKRAARIASTLVTVGAISYAVLRPSERETNAPATLAPAHRQVTFTGKESAPTLSPDGRRIA